MKKYISIFVVTCLIVAGVFIYHPFVASASCGNGYSYCRQVTLNLATYNPASQSNFTVLVCANGTLGNGNSCATVAGLNQTGGGAHVQNSNGYDIVFTSDAGCVTNLNWEMEKYVASTGEMEAWVLVTSLGTSNQNIYMCYGNGSISTFQGGATGTAWDSNYLGVYHFPDGSSLNVNDSTGLNNATNYSASATTGQIDGSASFPGVAGDYVGTPSINLTTTFSVEAWANVNADGGNYMRVAENGYSNGFDLGINVNISGGFIFIVSGDLSNVTWNPTIGTGTWYSLAGTYDGTTATFYGNGVSRSSHAETAPSIGSSVISIGDYILHSGNSSAWNGPIDEVRFSKVARSANWITTEYNNQSAPNTFETFGSELTPSAVVTSSLLQLTNVSLKINNAKVKILGN